MTEIPLRRWQSEAKERVEEAWLHGVRNPTVVAPTGSGKSRLAAALIDDFPGRTLFTVHRDQLIGQTRDSFLELIPDRSIGIIRGADNQIDADVIVASLQTLASKSRLQKYLEVNPPDLVIADEAHMSGAPQFAKVFQELGVPTHRVFSLGLSATLGRTTGTQLHELWSDPVYNMSLLEAIEEGICVPPVGIRIHMPEGKSLLDGTRDAAAWSTTIGNALESTDAPNIIAEALVEHCQGRACIGFAPNVRAALVLAEGCRRRGLTAEVITAHTPDSERRELFRASKDGELKVLWSVDTISVGADLPWVSAVVLARDSGSRTWFVQAVGRGLRTYPGKTDCLVLDCSSTSKRIKLDTFFDFGRDADEQEGSESKAGSGVADLEDIGGIAPVHVGRVEYSGFDFFTREYSWSTSLGGIRFLGSYQQLVFILPDGDGDFTVGSVSSSLWKNDKAKRHASELDLHSAVQMAELVASRFDKAAPIRYGKQMKISSQSANWRTQNKPLTEGQKLLMGQLKPALTQRVANHIGVDLNRLNRATAASLIDVVSASAVLSRLGLDGALD